MATLTVRLPDDESEWSEGRFEVLTGALVTIGEGMYPITGGRLDEAGRAVLLVDTGAEGPAPEAGTELGTFGTVEHVDA